MPRRRMRQKTRVSPPTPPPLPRHIGSLDIFEGKTEDACIAVFRNRRLLFVGKICDDALGALLEIGDKMLNEAGEWITVAGKEKCECCQSQPSQSSEPFQGEGHKLSGDPP